MNETKCVHGSPIVLICKNTDVLIFRFYRVFFTGTQSSFCVLGLKYLTGSIPILNWDNVFKAFKKIEQTFSVIRKKLLGTSEKTPCSINHRINQPINHVKKYCSNCKIGNMESAYTSFRLCSILIIVICRNCIRVSGSHSRDNRGLKTAK